MFRRAPATASICASVPIASFTNDDIPANASLLKVKVWQPTLIPAFLSHPAFSFRLSIHLWSDPSAEFSLPASWDPLPAFRHVIWPFLVSALSTDSFPFLSTDSILALRSVSPALSGTQIAPLPGLIRFRFQPFAERVRDLRRTSQKTGYKVLAPEF